MVLALFDLTKLISQTRVIYFYPADTRTLANELSCSTDIPDKGNMLLSSGYQDTGYRTNPADTRILATNLCSSADIPDNDYMLVSSGYQDILCCGVPLYHPNSSPKNIKKYL